MKKEILFRIEYHEKFLYEFKSKAEAQRYVDKWNSQVDRKKRGKFEEYYTVKEIKLTESGYVPFEIFTKEIEPDFKLYNYLK